MLSVSFTILLWAQPRIFHEFTLYRGEIFQKTYREWVWKWSRSQPFKLSSPYLTISRTLLHLEENRTSAVLEVIFVTVMQVWVWQCVSTWCVCVCVFGIGLKVSDKRHRENPVQAKQSACCISVCDRCGDRVCVVIRDGGGGRRHGHICGYWASCIDPGPDSRGGGKAGWKEEEADNRVNWPRHAYLKRGRAPS